MNIKYNFEVVKELCESKGMKWLDRKYEPKTLLYVQCRCVRKMEKSLETIRIGAGGCRSCSQKSKIPKRKAVKKLFAESGCKLLARSYKNCETPLSYICSCGTKWKTSLSNFKKGHRCLECSRQRRARYGSEHAQWNPNNTQAQHDRYSAKNSRWTQRVFKRDDWQCQCCDKRGGELHAHHVLNFSSHPKLRFKRSNGVTLCKKCHTSFHSLYGNKNNDETQLRRFIRTMNRKRK